MALDLPITLLYMAYYHPPGHNSTRFLLPTFFIYTIAAVEFLKIRTENEPARAKKETGILLGLTILWGLPLSLYELRPSSGTMPAGERLAGDCSGCRAREYPDRSERSPATSRFRGRLAACARGGA